MTCHVFVLNPGSVTQGVCSCGNWDGHTSNHHLHARTQNGHNVKQPTDYLAEAKKMIADGDADRAIPYALIDIAESLRAASAQNLAAAAEAGAQAAINALTTVADITGVTIPGGN